VIHPLIADSNLSLVIAAAGSFAALISVVIAALVQRDLVRERHRQRFGSAIEYADVVRWAAHNYAHEWGQPLGNYRLSYAILPRSRFKLTSARQLSQYHDPTTDDPDRFVPEAEAVEKLAAEAVVELRKELAKLP
jgi:hypothetical protein